MSDTTDLARLTGASVHSFPDPREGGPMHFVISLATAADGFPVWGSEWWTRDRNLRDFYVSEATLAGTVHSLSARNAALSWTLEGPPRTVGQYQGIFHRADFGKGWTQMILKLSTDLYTQDNGAFMEIIRAGDSPTAPLVGLAHLDAARVMRTGDPEIPYYYTDIDGGVHRLKWYQCIDFTDAPSPNEDHYGLQLCAVSRVLSLARILRNVLVRKDEKLTGRFTGAMHIISGLSTDQLTQALASAEQSSDQKGRTRYMPPVLLGTIDPMANVKKETIELASLPEGYSDEETYKWAIAILALGFQCEYQDLAPLPGGGLGTSQQSQTLHLKSKGKGVGLFQKLIEHRLNFFVLPENVTFKFDEKDYQTDVMEADIASKRASTYKTYADMGMPSQVLWQIMEDDRAIKPEIAELLSKYEDATPDQTATDETQFEPTEDREPLPEDQTPPAQEQKPKIPRPTDQTVDDAEQRSKALANDRFWEQQRQQLEDQYYQEVAAVLADAGRQIEQKLRDEFDAD